MSMVSMALANTAPTSITQSELAGWIQVAAAVIGILLALYIPVRMKRLDDYERLKSAVARVDSFTPLFRLYVEAMKGPERRPVPREVFQTVLAAANATIQEPLTTSELIPIVGRAVERARLVLNHWEHVAIHNASWEAVENVVSAHVAELESASQKANEVLQKWKKDHRLALFLHG